MFPAACLTSDAFARVLFWGDETTNKEEEEVAIRMRFWMCALCLSALCVHCCGFHAGSPAFSTDCKLSFDAATGGASLRWALNTLHGTLQQSSTHRGQAGMWAGFDRRQLRAAASSVGGECVCICLRVTLRNALQACFAPAWPLGPWNQTFPCKPGGGPTLAGAPPPQPALSRPFRGA